MGIEYPSKTRAMLLGTRRGMKDTLGRSPAEQRANGAAPDLAQDSVNHPVLISAGSPAEPKRLGGGNWRALDSGSLQRMDGIGKVPMKPDRSPQTGGVEHLPERPTATVVTFPANGRRFRRPVEDTPRGAILLFTGVRYERMCEPNATPRLRRRS